MGPHPAVAVCRKAVRDHLADLEPGAVVLVACSGGADSLALAAATAFEASRAGVFAGAVTVDHGLQQGSDQHAKQLAERLRALGLDPVEVATVTVTDEGGPEAAARRARYTALASAAGRARAQAVLLGHTRDDQAETVLLGLARGSGARSLAGMAQVAGLYRRPFLRLDRETCRLACEALGEQPWEDPHNLDPAYTRVRVRHDVLPVLESELGPGVAAALARTADQLRSDADALDSWAEQAYAHGRCEPRSKHGLRVEALTGLPEAIRRRVLRRAALEAGSPATDLFAVHVAGIDALVVNWHGQAGVDLPGGIRAYRREGCVLFRPVSMGP
jgi:tRNA(Ile)-lysidine synthase